MIGKLTLGRTSSPATELGDLRAAGHGRRGLARLVLGSVADKVIRGAHVPVLVHRPVKH